MKIAMVLAEDLPGWGGSHAASLAQALRGLGHDVHLHGPGEAGTTPRGAGADLRLGAFADALRTRWDRTRPDLVHAHFLRSGLAAVLAAQRSGVPVVQSFHGVAATEDNGVERLVGKEAALVVANAEQEVLDLAAAGVPRARTEVVARGVDTDLFTPIGPVGTRSKLRRIVTSVESSADNGVADLIAALPRLRGVELVVAGTAPGRMDRLARWADRLGVRERTHLLGPVRRQDMPALFRSADVVACVPHRTSWNPVALEAMACGRPVVGTAVGGLTDAVIDDVTGLLVPPGDPKRLTRALWEVLEDETLRTSCGIAAADRVQARHTWQDVAVCVNRLYRRFPSEAEAARSGTGAR